MQIGFYMDRTDEARFAEMVVREGSVFLPASYSSWPIPVMRPPLPDVTTPYMHTLSIWHPEIFREDEMRLENHRPYNPAGEFYLSHLWPVLEFDRSNPDNPQMFLGSLRMEASFGSFRVGKRLPQFSENEVRDFTDRAQKLERFYRKLCTWIRREFVKLERAIFCGPSAISRLPNWMQEHTGPANGE